MGRKRGKSKSSDRGWERCQDRERGTEGKKGEGIKGWLVAHVMEETWSLASLAGSLLMCFTHPAKSMGADHWTLNFNCPPPIGDMTPLTNSVCAQYTSPLMMVNAMEHMCNIMRKRHANSENESESKWSRTLSSDSEWGTLGRLRGGKNTVQPR